MFFLLSQPLPDRVQVLEKKLKTLEDEGTRRSTENSLITLRRHLNRPLNMFDRYEAIELLQSLVRLARNEAHEKADLYAAALDEVRARADLLDNESLQRLLVGLLEDPVRARIADCVTLARGLTEMFVVLIAIVSAIWHVNVIQPTPFSISLS